MATALRSVGYEDQLTIVEHLDELRTRLIVSLAAFLVVFGFCFWQSGVVLDVVNHPFEEATAGQSQKGSLAKTAIFQRRIARLATAQRSLADALRADPDQSAATRAAAVAVAESARAVQQSVPPDEKREPVTLGVAEPFTQTFKLAAYAALLLTLPLMLWQLYAFVLPAFSKRERDVALPLMLAVPFLFVAGASFAYFFVLPRAIGVLQGFNADQFDVLIQARDLYKFSIFTCIGLGALFQVPIAVLLLVRMEIVSIAQLRANRRYAIVVIAVIAMLLPGTDPISFGLCFLPLVALYEGSIILAALLNRRARRAAAAAGDDDLVALDDED